MSRASTVAVVAGGYSFRAVREQGLRVSGVSVIGVNDTGLLIECNSVVSMDRLWAENRWSELCRLRRNTFLRRSAMQNIRERPAWLKVFDCENKPRAPSATLDRLEGNNSGLCALNLAYLDAITTSARRIVLFGFDLCRGPKGEAHWYPDYPWTDGKSTPKGKLRDWASELSPFADACKARGIEVLNASLVSLIPNFPKRDPREVCS
jgi:hypothetical protein